MNRLLILVLVLLTSSTLAVEVTPPKFVAVGYGLRRLVSDDGVHWSEQVDPDPIHASDKSFLLRGVAYGKGTIVAVGGSQTTRILVSTDGKEWTDHSLQRNWLGDVAFGNDRFVAVGYQRTMVSQDGREWSKVIPLRDASWRRIEFGNGRFVAVGNYSAQDPESGCVTTSADGENWTTTIVSDKVVPSSVAFGNGAFVVVGNHGLRQTSKDGVRWENRILGDKDESLTGVIWTGREFLAYGNRGVHASPDGITWTKTDLKFPSRFFAFGDGLYVGSHAGQISYSKDGKTWTLAKTEGTPVITKVISTGN